MLRLVVVDHASPLAHQQWARLLMQEYAALPHTAGRWTTVDADLAALPAPFVAPLGTLLVAMRDGDAVGCGALRTIAPGVGEVKRMYVQPSARGQGVGEALLRALIAAAAAMGLERLRLDTAPELRAAQALYRRFGFTPIPRYRDDLLDDALCFERMVQDTPLPD